MSDSVSAAHQDNFLMLLCYEPDVCQIIASVVNEGLFTTQIYRDVAKAALSFLEQYKQPIGDHLADEFNDILQGDDAAKRKLYRDVLLNVKELHQEGVNIPYCMNILHSWANQQNFKVALTEAADMLINGHLEEAQARIARHQNMSDAIFDGGVSVSDNPSSFLDHIPNPDLIGIGPFDRVGFGPETGTVLTFVAPTGRGKSWFLVHVGKMLSMQRVNTLHISLEMSEERVKRRYVQNFLAISKREATSKVVKFVTNKKTGKAESIDLREVRTPTLVDSDIRDVINEKMAKIARTVRVNVKQFPTSSLSVPELESFLDQQERLTGAPYDAIILDYLDLMKISADNLRVETGQAMKDFRRLAGERNLRGITASQTNRSGEDTKIITSKHLAEDYSKAHTSDRVATYNQTNAEKQLGLARLYAAKNRDDEDGTLVVISQAYGFGQFALDATFLPAEYDVLVDAKAGGAKNDD